jgi:hypothetical protein
MDQKTRTHATVENYVDLWNETNPAARRELVEKVRIADALSSDPLAEVRGWSAIEAHIARTQAQFPWHRIARVGEVDQHHDRLRFPWALRDADGNTVLTGIDCVRLAGDGRFAELIGFFDSAV